MTARRQAETSKNKRVAGAAYNVVRKTAKKTVKKAVKRPVKAVIAKGLELPAKHVTDILINVL